MPFKSKAQRRKFYALKAEGKMDQKTIDEWESKTPNRIPEKVASIKLALEKQAAIPVSSLVGATHALAGTEPGAASAALGAPPHARTHAAAGSAAGSWLGAAGGAAAGGIGGALGGAAIGYGAGHMYSESPLKQQVIGSMLGAASGLGTGALLGIYFKNKPLGIIASMIGAPVVGLIGGQAFANDVKQQNRVKKLLGASIGAVTGGASGGKAGAIAGSFFGGKAGYEYGAKHAPAPAPTPIS